MLPRAERLGLPERISASARRAQLSPWKRRIRSSASVAPRAAASSISASDCFRKAVISSGVGSETQRPFAVVIISGLMTAVAVTLFVLPSVYSYIVRTSPRAVVDREGEA